MADTQLQALTENTTPALTDITYLVDDPAGTPLSQYVTVQNLRGGYELQFGIVAVNPADSQTYYFGWPETAALTTSQNVRKKYINKVGTLTHAYITWTSSAGSAENSALYVRINAATDVTLTSTLAFTTAGSLEVTGLSQAMAVTDRIEIKWVCPAWATNPTSVSILVQLWFD
jgi:hypothetical protein